MLWRSVWGWVLGGVGTCGGRGGGGAVAWEGARRRSDASDVCVVLRVEKSSRRSSSRPALSSRGGAPWGEEGCHMPSRLNPNCVGGPGHPPELTRCDSVIGLAIPAMSGHIQYRGAASGDLYIRISGINRVLLS